MNMITKTVIKNIRAITIVCAVLVSAIFISQQVMAVGLKDQACGAAGTADISNCTSSGNGDAAATSLAQKISSNIVNVFSLIIGVVAVIMIMVGGFRYIISNGDSNSLKGAKDTIIYALVGVVIALFAQVIARFVLAKMQ